MAKLKQHLRTVKFLLLYVFYKLGLFRFPDLAYSDAHDNDVRDIRSQTGADAQPVPKVIWMYWDDLTPPDFILAFYAKMKQMNPDHQIRLLNRESVKTFLPWLRFDYAQIGMSHKGDVIRLALLKEYGGIWVDSSTLVYQDFSWVHQRSGYDVVGYYSDGTTVDKDFPVVEAWFLASPPGNAFIARWLELIMPLTHISIDDYYAQITQRSDFADIRQGINRGSYIIINFLCQIVMREQPGFSCYLKRCESSAFFYQDAFRWDSLKMSLFLLCSREPATHPRLIKLTNDDRRFLPLVRRLNILERDSVMGKLLLENRTS